MKNHLLRTCCGLLAALTLCSCGDSAITARVALPGIEVESSVLLSNPLSSRGVVSVAGSVVLNGVSYDTSATSVTVNRHTGTVSDLRPGQIVSLAGLINNDNATGTANTIVQNTTVIGPVQSIDASRQLLIVMGQVVRTNHHTVFGSGINSASFSGLRVGSMVQISGFSSPAGEIAATRIELDVGSAAVQVIGTVSGSDRVNMLFSINRLTVAYAAAELIDLPGGVAENGMLVLVDGSLVDGILIARQIRNVFDARGADGLGHRVQSEGIVTRVDARGDFYLNGTLTMIDIATRFVNGTADDLVAGAHITVDGEIASGHTILANVITFSSIVSDIARITFDYADFTEISVSGIFHVDIKQGNDFSVVVTVDEDVVDELVVTQSGSRLSIGLQDTGDHIETIHAVVTLPLLSSIDLSGVTHVTLRQFDQAQMQVDVAGVSRLKGESLMIGSLIAQISGVSQLDFGETRPVATASIDLSGKSSATLNMDVGASLAGSVTGASSLFYYGTDVTANVTTDATSSSTRLGETRS